MHGSFGILIRMNCSNWLKVLKRVGYLNQESAKRSLINNYKIDVDYTIIINDCGENRNQDGKFMNENIYMTKLCFFNFITTSKKPVL